MCDFWFSAIPEEAPIYAAVHPAGVVGVPLDMLEMAKYARWGRNRVDLCVDNDDRLLFLHKLERYVYRYGTLAHPEIPESESCTQKIEQEILTRNSNSRWKSAYTAHGNAFEYLAVINMLGARRPKTRV